MSKPNSHNVVVNRMANLAILIITIITAIIPFLLTPSAIGIGTHQQIIPVPCLFRMFIRIPCPSCGLTTSISHLLHGDILKSFVIHPLGPTFFVLLVIIIIQSIRGLIKGLAWWNVTEKRWFQNLILCGIGLYLGIWVMRLIT